MDDAIVIVENASHYIEQGLTPKDSAIKAMGELTGPVLGITLVLTSVFCRRRSCRELPVRCSASSR